MDRDLSDDSKTRRRNQTACEACRVTKIRCQASEQPGVCKKCLESKRECISRTTPRNRRSKRQIKVQGEATSQSNASSPAPKPASSTFSIDFAVPAQPDVDNNFDMLREMHQAHLDQCLPSDEDLYLGPFDGSSGILEPTPPASASTPSNSIESLGGKPQFNLASAQSLLESFRRMLPSFPCIVLEDGDSVSDLAKTRPFVLLAILATASGSRTLQGHSLYDEEFRKVLGLKFVAGGERTLELLQGLLIYCAWYPFHLRPKNKQVFHYLRMCSDLITDLELDQGPVLGEPAPDVEASNEQLDGIRAYLAHCHLVASFVVGWRKYRNLSTGFTTWMYTCCDLLERNPHCDNDLALVTCLRFSGINNQASDTMHERRFRTEQQDGLLLLGLETQTAQLKQRIPPRIAATKLARLATLFTDIFLSAGPLAILARPNSFLPQPLAPDAAKLTLAVPLLAQFLREILLLEQPSFMAFSAVEWGRLILVVILSFRASFAVADCPLFDHVWARGEIQLGSFLERFCAETDLTALSRKVDILSASRVVMRVVKDKYGKRLQRESSPPGASGCPMLDGSLDQYFPLWDASLDTATMNPATGGEGKTPQPVFHDVWATMTMSWANDASEL